MIWARIGEGGELEERREGQGRRRTTALKNKLEPPRAGRLGTRTAAFFPGEYTIEYKVRISESSR